MLAQHDINVLPEGEPHVLLVDLAAANKDVKMVCLLVDRCNCVLSYKVSLHDGEDVACLTDVEADKCNLQFFERLALKGTW